MNLTTTAIHIVGVIAVVLGILHFTFPKSFGFMHVISETGDDVPPFKLLFYRYDMTRADLRGITYVMNHCVSYVIVAIGVFDLYAHAWMGTSAGAIASTAAAGFWTLRAATQLYLGRRPGDLFVIAFFTALAVIQFLAGITS